MNRRGLWIALFISLALNLFVLGAFAGVLLARWSPAPEPPARPGPQGKMGLGFAAQSLPQERQEAWRQALREQARLAGPTLRESRNARREAWQGLSGDAFDSEQALSALERSRRLESEARAGMDRRMVEFAASLAPQDRKAFAEALTRMRPGLGRPGGGPHGSRGEGHPPPPPPAGEEGPAVP